MSGHDFTPDNKVLDLFFILFDDDTLWVSSDPRELELKGARCLATYNVSEIDIKDSPARAAIVKLLECYTMTVSTPGQFPDGYHDMPGFHIAELLAVAFRLGAKWAHDNPDDPSGHNLDVSA